MMRSILCSTVNFHDASNGVATCDVLYSCMCAHLPWRMHESMVVGHGAEVIYVNGTTAAGRSESTRDGMRLHESLMA